MIFNSSIYSILRKCYKAVLYAIFEEKSTNLMCSNSDLNYKKNIFLFLLYQKSTFSLKYANCVLIKGKGQICYK